MMSIKIEEVQPLLNAKGNYYVPGVVQSGQCEINNDKLKYNLCLEITSGPLAGNTVYADLYFTPAAMDKSLKRLADCFKYDGGMQNLNHADFSGLPVQVAIKIEEYNGEDRVRFGIFPPKKPLDDDEFSHALKMLGVKPPVIAPPMEAPKQPLSVKTAAPPIDDSDLPF